ncbi:MAG: ROK family transcriptional regulator [Anaerolineae bacterium]
MMHPQRKATRELTKLHNRRLVFTTIYNAKQISRADIARLTDLTPTTVSGVVAELMEKRLVVEDGMATLPRGKPPAMLHVNKDAYHMLCLDLAKASFQGALVNLRGEILYQRSIHLGGRTGDAALSVAFELIDSLLPIASSPILGIAVGAPGIIDPDRGIVHRAVNFEWHDLPLRQMFQERYPVPVYIANASYAAVLAEYTFGRRRNVPDLVVVKVGYDVGAGIILNGEPFLGHRFGAGEIGHMVVVENGERCMCGNFGCLETVASSRAIVRRAQEIARDSPASLLHAFAPSPTKLDIRAVLRAYEAGEPALQPVVAEVGHYLGLAIANLVSVLSVPYVLIAGSVSNFGQPLLDAITKEVYARSLARTVSQTVIETASLGAEIVLLGAAGLLLRHEMGVV